MKSAISRVIRFISILILVLPGVLVVHLFIPSVGNPVRSRRQIARIQIMEIENALRLFRWDIGRFPSEKEGISALVKNPGGLAS